MGDLFGPTSILSHFADSESVDSFIAWRKRTKKPLTDRAAKMIAKTLAAINEAGGDATEALDLAQEHGWQTIKSEWYWNLKNGQRNSNQKAAGAHTTTRAIAIAARVRRPSSGDMF